MKRPAGLAVFGPLNCRPRDIGPRKQVAAPCRHHQNSSRWFHWYVAELVVRADRVRRLNSDVQPLAACRQLNHVHAFQVFVGGIAQELAAADERSTTKHSCLRSAGFRSHLFHACRYRTIGQNWALAIPSGGVRQLEAWTWNCLSPYAGNIRVYYPGTVKPSCKKPPFREPLAAKTRRRPLTLRRPPVRPAGRPR